MSEKSDTDDGTTGVATKEQERKQTSCRTEEVVSNSDTSDDSNTSDDELMVKYGAQRVSSRNKQPKGKKKENETDENEIALALLGNRTKKRPLSLSKGSKAKKCCRPRSSDSDEDSDELYTVCKLCNEKVLKEMYEQHVNEELEERKRTGGAPRKEEGTGLLCVALEAVLCVRVINWPFITDTTLGTCSKQRKAGALGAVATEKRAPGNLQHSCHPHPRRDTG